MLRTVTLAMALVLSGSWFSFGGTAAQGEDVEHLLRARLVAAQRAWEKIERTSSETVLNYPQARLWSDRLVAAELAIASNSSHRVAALENQLKRAKMFEKFVKTHSRSGVFTPMEVLEVEYHRLEVELRLAEVRGLAANR